MDPRLVRELLERVQGREVPVDDALETLRQLPFRDIGVATVDHHRALRQGVPEVIFGERKTVDQIERVAEEMARAGNHVLVTRVDPDKAAAILAQYRRDVPDTSAQRVAAPGLHGTLGSIAIARGDGKTAISEFRKADVWYDGLPSTECAPCIHFALARAFDAASEADSAIAEYEAYLATPFWAKLFGGDYGQFAFGDAMVLAGVHKRLGELYEANGDRAKAASHDAAFIELWKNADPELQPQVQEVRRRLARLGGSEP